MASISKQQKRAKRAKTKAKQARVARQNPQIPDPVVPDYFMPDFAPEDDEPDIDDLLLESYLDPELLEDMDDEERQAIKDLINGDAESMLIEDEVLLEEVFTSPAPAPTEEQRITHYEQLRQAEQEGEHALLLAFAKGPIAAHALFDIDFADYDDILVQTLGGYWKWAHGMDEQAARARIVNDDFYEAMRDALSQIEEEDILRTMTTFAKKDDEQNQD